MRPAVTVEENSAGREHRGEGTKKGPHRVRPRALYRANSGSEEPAPCQWLERYFRQLPGCRRSVLPSAVEAAGVTFRPEFVP
jgi:hypothetical protein